MNQSSDQTSNDLFLITGANGLLGKTMVNLLGDSSLALNRQQLDLASLKNIQSSLDRIIGDRQVRAVLNCAAYTRVDQAEENESLAMTVNGEAPGELAAWCADRNIPLVHFSSDYVFSGEGEIPWREDDPTSPINVYGRSKAEGDLQVSQRGRNWLVFRPTWVYGRSGKSFFTSMIDKAKEQTLLRVVYDQVGAPTYADPLCQAVLMGLSRACSMPVFPNGIYHLCHSGETNWYEFCCMIVSAAKRSGLVLKVERIEPVTTESFMAPARRPLNSRLNTEKVYQVLGIRLPDWKIGFEACVQDTFKLVREH